MNKSEAAIARWKKPTYRKKMAANLQRGHNFKHGAAAWGNESEDLCEQ